jgi:hypothetical protein
MKMPPPEKRLCAKHGKPICPSMWRNRSRTTGCAKCMDMHKRSPEARERRRVKWNKEYITCARHPNDRCQQSTYVNTGQRRCSYCSHHYADGSRKPGYARHVDWDNPGRKRLDRRSRAVLTIKKIHRGLQVGRNPLNLFADLTGMGRFGLNMPRS